MFLPLLAALITAAGGVYTAKMQQDNYNQQLQYNSPAAQMQRFKDAGLSPWLMYGQGNPGNATTTAPVVFPDINQSLSTYASAANFREDVKAKRLQNAMLANEVKQLAMKNKLQSFQLDKTIADVHSKTLNLLTDYPNFDFNKYWNSGGRYNDQMLTDSWRQKEKETKRALSLATLSRLEQEIEGKKQENVVKSVKAGYARDYGMVSGDMVSQGFGLLKSLPNLAKSFNLGRKTIPASEKALIDSYRKYQNDKHKRDAGRFLFDQLIH